MTSTNMPPSKCLNCGKLLDAATCVQGKHAPDAGSLSICIDCGAVTIFGDDLRLRPLTEAEAKDVQSDTVTWHLLRRASALIHFYKAARN